MAKNTTAVKTTPKAEKNEAAGTPKGNRAKVLTALLSLKAIGVKAGKTGQQIEDKCGVRPAPSGPNVKAGLVGVAVAEEGGNTYYLTAAGLKTARAL